NGLNYKQTPEACLKTSGVGMETNAFWLTTITWSIRLRSGWLGPCCWSGLVRRAGAGCSGFERMPATSSFMPSVLSALRYLYHVVRLSFHAVFGCANFGSVPA